MIFRKAVKEYERKCAAAGVPEETVMAYLVEIANQERCNLYMHYDEEMPAELEARFHAGMKRILNQ